MAAKCAKIDRVDSLDTGFQQVPLIQNFWNFHNIVMEHQYFKASEEKQKSIFKCNFFKNPVYYRNCLGQIHFLS